MKPTKRSLSLVLALLTATGVLRAESRTWQVPPIEEGPGIVVRLDELGSLYWKVLLRGRTILAESPLGLRLWGKEGNFLRGLAFQKADRRPVLERFTLTTGKRLVNEYRFNELRLTFKNEGGRELVLVFRTARDGAAFRYILPGKGVILVERERTFFRFPRGTRAWILPWKRNYEQLFQEGELGKDFQAGRYGLPLLVKAPGEGNTWALIHEADLGGEYAAANLSILDPSKPELEIFLPVPPIRDEAPLAAPWRVILAGGLGDIVESTLIEALSRPSEAKDTSWIRPGKCAWSWWSESRSPHSLEKQKAFVDFAASLGWPYCLVDEGWRDHDWVPELIRYARAKGVSILLWTRWTDLDTPEKRKKELSLWKKWGVAGIKVDFMDRDDQEMTAFYDAVTKAALAEKLLINFHGAIPPRGERRRFPNLMTREGVLGAEHYKWSKRPTPEHNCLLPFTRNAVGPMDYTPVTFSAKTRRTTAGHELALAVVFESGIQHFADSPRVYDSAPYKAGLDLLRQVPVAWDETRFLAGYPGKFVALARRKGKTWYVGIIAAGNPVQRGKRMGVSLSRFLSRGSWKVEAYGDAPGREGIEKETFTTDAARRFFPKLKKNGGLVMVFKPL